MKTCKILCRKVKISISRRGGNFQFSARGERYMYLKKKMTWGEFHHAYVLHASSNYASDIEAFYFVVLSK